MKKLIVDASHSEIGFKIKHLMISTVKGSFSEYEGKVEVNEGKSNIDFSVKTSSINTNSKDRDGHLKGEDFFESEKYPTIDFVAKNVDLNSNKLNGEITIKGVTKPITLDVQYNGVNVDPWGNTKHGYEIAGVVKRNDFGLVWNAPLSTGGLLLDEEVKLNLDVQLLELKEELETAN